MKSFAIGDAVPLVKYKNTVRKGGRKNIRKLYYEDTCFGSLTIANKKNRFVVSSVADLQDVWVNSLRMKYMVMHLQDIHSFTCPKCAEAHKLNK